MAADETRSCMVRDNWSGSHVWLRRIGDEVEVTIRDSGGNFPEYRKHSIVGPVKLVQALYAMYPAQLDGWIAQVSKKPDKRRISFRQLLGLLSR